MEVGCQQEGGWMMGSYKRTSVCWQKVKVSEVAGRGICFFQAVLWAIFYTTGGGSEPSVGGPQPCVRLPVHMLAGFPVGKAHLFPNWKEPICNGHKILCHTGCRDIPVCHLSIKHVYGIST